MYICPENSSAGLTDEFTETLKSYVDNIEIHHQLIDLDEHGLTEDAKSSKLLIIDDMMTTVFSSQSIITLLSRQSHHSNVSVIISTQNFYYNSKHSVTALRQFTDIVLFHSKVC